ncbi:MAG: hypothetical protein JO106_13255, partial [Mycobacterium sp.]|nr:hypothetical protein [Mycobacterium sp.]
TRDYLRRELDELRTFLEEIQQVMRPPKDATKRDARKTELAERRAKRAT